MSAALPSHQAAPSPSPWGPRPSSVEALQDLLGGLLLEREDLRRAGAAPFRLEHNRREIARAHRELARALGALHAAG